MRTRPLLAVAIVTLVVAGSVDHVRALRAASPYALTLLAPRQRSTASRTIGARSILRSRQA